MLYMGRLFMDPIKSNKSTDHNPRIKSTVYIDYQKSTYIWMCGPNEWYLRMINNIKFMSQWNFFFIYIMEDYIYPIQIK